MYIAMLSAFPVKYKLNRCRQEFRTMSAQVEEMNMRI